MDLDRSMLNWFAFFFISIFHSPFNFRSCDLLSFSLQKKKNLFVALTIVIPFIRLYLSEPEMSMRNNEQKKKEKESFIWSLRTVHRFIQWEEKKKKTFFFYFVHFIRASNCFIEFTDSDTSNKFINVNRREKEEEKKKQRTKSFLKLSAFFIHKNFNWISTTCSRMSEDEKIYRIHFDCWNIRKTHKLNFFHRCCEWGGN